MPDITLCKSQALQQIAHTPQLQHFYSLQQKANISSTTNLLLNANGNLHHVNRNTINVNADEINLYSSFLHGSYIEVRITKGIVSC